jgi:tetratricopeptide (TPR) repeat protein
MTLFILWLQTSCLAYLNLTEVDLTLKELPLIIENKVKLDRKKIRTYSEVLGATWLGFVGENNLMKNDHPYAKFQLALIFLEKQDLGNAIKNIEGVYAYSPIYHESLKVKAHILYKQNQFLAAIKTLELCEIYKLDSYRNTKHQNYHENLQSECVVEKARIYFRLGDFQNALNAYESISFHSMIWPNIILEKAWTLYKLGQYSKSNGILLALTSPLLINNYHFEVSYLKALNFYKLCLYDEAHTELQNSIRSEKTKTSKNFYIINSIGIQHLYNLSDDIALVNQSGHLNSFNEKIQTKISELKNTYLNEIEKNNNFFKNQVLNLELNIIQSKRAYFYNPKKLSYKELGIAQVSENEESWNFDQEFWIDELQNYELKIKNKCLEEKYVNHTDTHTSIASTR